MNRLLVLALVVGLSVVGVDSVGVSSAAPGPATAAPIGPALQQQLATAGAQQMVEALVVLKSQAALSGIRSNKRAERLATVVRTLRAHASQTQQGVIGLLATRQMQRRVSSVVPLWIANEVAVTATPAVIKELAARPDVREVRPNFMIQASASSVATTSPSTVVEPNVSLVRAPAMWDQGFRGQGVVVANMDTGVDATHPDLTAKWRGGTNSWYDPNGQHPTAPTDVNGHGTQTMGVMVGGDQGGSAVGVAPDARWIAVKIFNDRGTATATGIHLGFQWLLDPDGNPSTADAPNVVDASWTTSGAGCNLDFQLDLRSLRAAGILPIFAAGNYGPAAGTIYSPANLPEAFAVGETDNDDVLDPYSSRGPSACAGSVSPKLVAPGTGIRTTDLYGGYVTDTGTSVAAPHVAGSLALLLSAFPGLSADQQETALESAAVDLGSSGVDNDFGYGRLDVFAAYQRLATTPDFAVSVTPSSATTPPGGSVSYTLSLVGVNGFTGDVSLSLAGLSASQASWSFNPPVVPVAPGASGTAQLSVTTTTTIAPGSYPILVTGASGSNSRTATADLVIPAPPDFSLGVTSSSQSTVAGGSANYTVTVASLHGFTSDVALSLTGLPSAANATFTPTAVTAAGSSQLTISTSGAAQAGSYPLTITGTSGSLTHTTTVTLVVSSFTLSVSPSSQSVSAGSSIGYTVTVGALSGFTGNVTLSLTGLPSAATAAFTPTAVTGAGSSQLTINTSPITPSGSYPLTITGTSGSITRTTSTTLVVSVQDFSLTASPTSITIVRGQTASYTVSVSSFGGFTGSVSLSAAGLPSGSSASFSANPVGAPGTSTLRVRTTTPTTRGTFTLRITGKNGSLVHQATVTLIVR